MTPEEASNLLRVQSYQDGRQPSDGQIAVWADALTGLTHDDALAAMRSLWRDSRDYVTPALIRARHRELRRAAIVDERRRSVTASMAQVAACDLCGPGGYRYPSETVLCTHRPLRGIGAASQVRAALEARGEQVAS